MPVNDSKDVVPDSYFCESYTWSYMARPVDCEGLMKLYVSSDGLFLTVAAAADVFDATPPSNYSKLLGYVAAEANVCGANWTCIKE
ncbi:unnamed protein product, partial [Mesorhabditis spiculigera]